MMNPGKKLLSLLLAVMMLMGMMQTAAFAGAYSVDSSATITLEHEVTEALKPGDTFTVVAKLANNPGYLSAAFNVMFDREALTINDFVLSDDEEDYRFYIGGSCQFNTEKMVDEKPVAFITYASGSEQTKKKGNLFAMTFTVNANAKSGDYDIYIDPNAESHLFDNKDADGEFYTWNAEYVPATVTIEGNKADPEPDPEPTPVAVTGVKLDKTALEFTLGEASLSATLTATVTPENADNKAVVWSTSNPNVATVENGVVTAKGEGTATITVTTKDGSYQAECAVKVNPIPKTMNGDHADMNVSSELVNTGDTVQVKISVENDQNAESEYNSYEFVVSYDSANLTYKDFECDADENCAVSEKDGKLIVNGYGEIKKVSEEAFVILNFVASNDGDENITAEINLEEAYRDTSEMAINRDIDEIEVETTTKTVTIQPNAVEYEVTFSENVKINGEVTNSVKAAAGETVAFDIIPQTGKDVTVTGAAKVDEDTYQVIVTGDANVTITYTAKTYNVTIKDGSSEKKDTVTYGEDYEFTVESKENYTLDSVQYQIGAGDAIIITANDEGKYVIPGEKILDDVTITINRTYNDPGSTTKYTVTYYENGVQSSTVEVKQGEKHTVNAKEGYVIYQVGTAKLDPVAETYELTVSADISVYMGQQYIVSLPGGEDDGIVTGETEANYGTDYTFTVEDGYVPTVTIGGETVIPADNGDGTYTIAGADITGAIEIAVSKIVYADSVMVYNYVKVNGADDGAAVIQLVVATANANVAEGEILQYNGANMFWSSKYNAYAYPVLVNENDELLTGETAAALIGVAEATAVEIVYNGNVNMTANNVVDINDAQLVYDIYKAMYNNFTKVSMEKMLRADMNGNYEVTVSDVAAVAAIVNAK